MRPHLFFKVGRDGDSTPFSCLTVLPGEAKTQSERVFPCNVGAWPGLESWGSKGGTLDPVPAQGLME